MSRPGRPVIFLHGLWKGAAIWDRWIDRFDSEGYRSSAPLWPGESQTVEQSRRNPSAFGNPSLSDVVDHFERVIGQLDEPPICIGHSFGALIAEKLLASGLATAAVAMDPAQFGSALPGSVERLRESDFNIDWDAPDTVLMMTPDQFHRSFTAAATETDANEYFEKYAIPGSVRPLFEVAAEGFRLIPEQPAKAAGPLLLVPSTTGIEGAETALDPSIVQFRDSISVEVMTAFTARGHSLVFDNDWEQVADGVLDWLEQKGLQH
jgi:pimeloyl-ACP methyl ester carboxylesterase